MSRSNTPSKYKPRPSGLMAFQAVSVEAARAVLEELPSDVARVLETVPGYWQKTRRAPLATDRALTGNSLAVFLDGRGLSTEQMQALILKDIHGLGNTFSFQIGSVHRIAQAQQFKRKMPRNHAHDKKDTYVEGYFD